MSIRTNTKIRILRRAIEILSPRGAWTRGATGQDKQGFFVHPEDDAAVQWCALGAISKAAFESDTRQPLVWNRIMSIQDELNKTVKEIHPFIGTIVGYNDAIAKRKTQVINVFEKTIARLEAE